MERMERNCKTGKKGWESYEIISWQQLWLNVLSWKGQYIFFFTILPHNWVMNLIYYQSFPYKITKITKGSVCGCIRYNRSRILFKSFKKKIKIWMMAMTYRHKSDVIGSGKFIAFWGFPHNSQTEFLGVWEIRMGLEVASTTDSLTGH